MIPCRKPLGTTCFRYHGRVFNPRSFLSSYFSVLIRSYRYDTFCSLSYEIQGTPLDCSQSQSINRRSLTREVLLILIGLFLLYHLSLSYKTLLPHVYVSGPIITYTPYKPPCFSIWPFFLPLLLGLSFQNIIYIRTWIIYVSLPKHTTCSYYTLYPYVNGSSFIPTNW